MKKRFLYGVYIFLFLSSCTANRSLPVERPLFPGIAEGKWWIVNSVIKDSGGKDVHFSALLGTESVSGKNYAANIVSIWQEKDSSYYSGVQNAPGIKIKSSHSFPISLSGMDSSVYQWNWLLKRNRLRLFATVRNNDNPVAKTFTADIEARFVKQRPFQVSMINAVPGIWSLKPLPAEISISGGATAQAAGRLNLHVLTGRSLLMDKAANSFVTWLDAGITGGKHLRILFTTDEEGNTMVETAFFVDENKQVSYRAAVTVKVTGKSHFVSAVSKKGYPLVSTIHLPGENIFFTVRPRMLQQEINQKRISFWMGAVELVEEGSGKRLGKGNMYIFKK